MTWRAVFFNKKKIAATLASEAEPHLFLACSSFLGKFEPRYSYKSVSLRNQYVTKNVVQSKLIPGLCTRVHIFLL